jgi:hypothetical protein
MYIIKIKTKTMEIKTNSKEYYDYIEEHILSNEDYKVQLQWLNGEMEYDDEYIREHLENNNIKLI